MASKESQRVNRYWKTVRQSAVAPQPDDLVSNAQWDVLTGEPGGVDYLEIDAGGVPALWAVPHGMARYSCSSRCSAERSERPCPRPAPNWEICVPSPDHSDPSRRSDDGQLDLASGG